MSGKAQIAVIGTGVLPSLLTLQEAAASLSVPLSTFERHVLPEIPVRKVRGQEMVAVADLERWFDEHAEPPTPRVIKPVVPDTWVYRFFDRAGVLLYVGVTNQCAKRFDQHGRERLWWREVAVVEDHFDTREEAEAHERELIRTSMPRYNAAGNPLWRAA